MWDRITFIAFRIKVKVRVSQECKYSEQKGLLDEGENRDKIENEERVNIK